MGGYPLLGRLGAGGMGQVFLSRTPSGRLLALKTIREDLSSEPGFEERFAREIRNSDRVRSPWTVTVVDYSPPGQHPQWLATEYVPAPALDDWVERQGPLNEAASLALAAELCGALRSVHEAGLTHRDVKPGNVLLAPDRPRLIDFGIARAADDTRHTRLGGVLGSPGFLAPDQAVGGVPAEPSDVFSLGAVLVYAATGHGPFTRAQEDVPAAALVYRAVHESPRLDGVPAALVPVLAACLAKDPGVRPTAAQLGERLAELGARVGQWAQVCPPGLAVEPPPLPVAQPTPTHVTPTHAAPTHLPPSAAAPSRRPRPTRLVVAAAALVVLGAAGILTSHLVTSGSAAETPPSASPAASPSASAPPSKSASKSASATASPSAEHPIGTRKELRSPYALAAGDSVSNGKVSLDMQTDGNLVVSDADGRPLWAAMTQGKGRGDHASFQTDGNLVVSNAKGKAVWGAGSFGHSDAVLVLRADGNVVIEENGTVLWETGTAH